MIFNCVKTLKLQHSISKILLNEEEDILVVSLSNGSVKMFFLHEERKSLHSTQFTKKLIVEELPSPFYSKNCFSPSALCKAQFNFRKLNYESINQNPDVHIDQRIEEYDDMYEFIVLYNKMTRSLEVYSTYDPDDIFKILSFQMSHSCNVEKIEYLERNLLALGGSSEDSSSFKQNLMVVNLSDFTIDFYGWKELESVTDMLYHKGSGILFIAAQSRYFAAFALTSKKPQILRKIEFRSPDFTNSRYLSFYILPGFKAHKRYETLKLIVTNESNKVYAYGINFKSRSIGLLI